MSRRTPSIVGRRREPIHADRPGAAAYSGRIVRRIVIVGAGQGGQQVAASLRGEGFPGAITLIGDEPGLPYQRPPLSKAYMKDGDAERLLLKPASFYDRSAIDYRPGTRVTRVDRERQEVVTAEGAAYAYDHLVLATGAHNVVPPLESCGGVAVAGLRTLADAAALRARLSATARAVVIGGGFIGLEFAAVARAAGLEVTVIEATDRLMGRVVSPAISAYFLDFHRSMGTEVILGARAAAIEHFAVRLADGGRVAGDLVLLAAGVRANSELAAAAGLATDDGVVVDAQLRTSDPAISALGDCARFPLTSGRLIRLESVQAAVDHARHIARRLVTGDTAAYAAVPWFWSDQGDRKLQIAGLALEADRSVVAPSPAGKLTVLHFAAECLTAVETVNAPAPHMAARRLLASGPVDAAEIEAAGFDLPALARARGPVSG
jgi:3-phenylpropionate/trans-cinnamate dioxygenase ferredoxin reductase subunit